MVRATRVDYPGNCGIESSFAGWALGGSRLVDGQSADEVFLIGLFRQGIVALRGERSWRSESEVCRPDPGRFGGRLLLPFWTKFLEMPLLSTSPTCVGLVLRIDFDGGWAPVGQKGCCLLLPESCRFLLGYIFIERPQ